MKEVIEAIGPDRAAMLIAHRTERILDSKELTPEKKLQLLEEVIYEQKEIIWFILSNN